MKNTKRKKKSGRKSKGSVTLPKKLTKESEMPGALTASGDIDLDAETQLPADSMAAPPAPGLPAGFTAVGVKQKKRWQDASRNSFSSKRRSGPKNYNR